jgi:hypothetical protein
MDKICFWADGDLSTLPDPVRYGRAQEITIMHISASRWQDKHWFEAELASRRPAQPDGAMGAPPPVEQPMDVPSNTEGVPETAE